MPRDKMLPLRTPKLELLSLQPIPVTSPDGVALAAYAWGNPHGREIVFIHGYSQCHLSWRRQIDDAALAGEFRMVAYDLRGHGASDQPLARERYRDDRLWADDLAAVIAAAGLERPTLVAWSYGGRVVADYVRFHGQDGIAAINYVAAITKSDRAFWGPALKYTAEMASNDLATNVHGGRPSRVMAGLAFPSVIRTTPKPTRAPTPRPTPAPTVQALPTAIPSVPPLRHRATSTACPASTRRSSWSRTAPPSRGTHCTS